MAARLNLFVILACAFGSGCAPVMRFGIVGDAGEVGAVSSRYNATRVEVHFVTAPGADAGLDVNFADDATRRLGSMLPAPDHAPEGAVTRFDIQYVLGDTAAKNSLKVKLVTDVDGHDVVTEEESPDLLDSGARTFNGGSLIAMYVSGATASACSTIGLAAAVVSVPCAILSLVGAAAALVAFVPSWIAYGVSSKGVADSVSSHGSNYLGEVLRRHAHAVARAANGGAAPAPAAATRDVPAAPTTAAPPATGAPPSAPTGTAPAVVEEKEWFVGVSGSPMGPLTASEIRAMHGAGKINYDSLVWKDGMQWTALRDVKALWSPDVPPPLPKPKAKK